MFCEGKNTVDVVIALDLPADEVRAIYREYWELKQMYELGQIYDEVEYDLHKLLRLHKIVKRLEMKEHDITCWNLPRTINYNICNGKWNTLEMM